MSISVYIIIILEELLALILLWKGTAPSPSGGRGAFTWKNIRPYLPAAFLISIAFMIRYEFLDYETTDYTWFLQKWVDFYRKNGGFAALDRSIGNYNIPYLYFLAWFSASKINDLYLIKLLSMFFDVVLSGVCMALAGKCGAGGKGKAVCFLLVLLLPTVVINSSVWAQCDSIYVSLGLLGIYLALDDRPILSVIAIAFSFGFKLQAVFIMPVFLILWFRKDLKLVHALVFPAAYLLLITPALLCGRPLSDAIMLYADQAGTVGTGMNYNSPSIFGILTNVTEKGSGPVAGIVAAFAAMALLLLLALANKKYLSEKVVLCFSLLLVTAIPFLLPHMHDRYFFAADVLSVVLAVVIPKCIPCAVCTQFASMICYLAYFRTYYLRVGHIFLTPDKGAWALVISMCVCVVCLSSELESVRKNQKQVKLKKS